MSSILVTSVCLHSRRGLPRGLTTTKSTQLKPGSFREFWCLNTWQTRIWSWDLPVRITCFSSIIPISWEFHILSPTKNAAGVNTFDFNYHNRIPPKEVQHFPKINIVTLCCNLAIPPSPGAPNIVRWHPWTSAKMLMLPRLHGLQIIVSGNNHKRNTISCCFISPIIRKVIFTPRVPLGFAKLSVRLWSLVGPRGPPLGGGGGGGVRRSQ